MKNVRVRAKRSETKEKLDLTIGNIAYELTEIFQQHIGRDNAITKTELFNEVFGKELEDGKLDDYVRWDFVLKAMSKLRKETSCFIISQWDYEVGETIFFVVRTREEAQVYTNRLKQSVKKINAMAKRALRAVDNKWYKDKDNWMLPNQKKELEKLE